MKNSITDEKISNFRDLVNSNSNFVFNAYSNNNGKNHWNLICSCMDWLTVSIRHLQHAPELDENIDVRVMQMFSLISSIDLVSESIAQLHRVFINPKTVPFSGERICFSQRIFDEDDNSYFKSIRASFGAHPVNLNQSTSKRFASWPFDSYSNDGELTVHLYSNKLDEDDLVMNLNSKELMLFLITRYNYLDVISKKINTLYDNFKKKLSLQRIETKDNFIEQLYILKIESTKRLNNDYYNDVISNLITIFENDIHQQELEIMFEDYKKALVPLIYEIKDNLQSMNIVDLEYASLLSPRSDFSRKVSYELGKFYTWINSSKYDPLADYYLDRFNSETNFKYHFSNNDSSNCLFIKAKLMLFNQRLD
ncbi:hypothetical protein C0W44_03965 [Photobacterium leiognathi subsp. mandapamensis]|nr:hypothetical protein C0W44_03965 [Photobacterium leiognathi subsp. mandapamensis]